MQKQTDELRQKLQQREDELATSQSNAQVCCTPVLSTVRCLYRCVVHLEHVTQLLDCVSGALCLSHYVTEISHFVQFMRLLKTLRFV